MPQTIYLLYAFVDTVKKTPLWVLADKKMAEHAARCDPGDNMLIGRLEEIDIDDSRDYSIWVENNLVYLIIKCPTELHELIAGYISSVTTKGLLEASLFDQMISSGSTDRRVTNNLACHASFNKQPDGSLRIETEFEHLQVFPVITCEVAVRHESLHRLLCEASIWLNDSTDVVYCIAAKFNDQTGRLRVYLFGRPNNEGSSQEGSEEEDDEGSEEEDVEDSEDEDTVEKKGKEVACNLPSKRLKEEEYIIVKKDLKTKICFKYKSSMTKSNEAIEKAYKVRILDSFDLTYGQDINRSFLLDIRELLAKSNIDVSLLPTSNLEIDWRGFSRRLWNLVDKLD